MSVWFTIAVSSLVVVLINTIFLSLFSGNFVTMYYCNNDNDNMIRIRAQLKPNPPWYASIL